MSPRSPELKPGAGAHFREDTRVQLNPRVIQAMAREGWGVLNRGKGTSSAGLSEPPAGLRAQPHRRSEGWIGPVRTQGCLTCPPADGPSCLSICSVIQMAQAPSWEQKAQVADTRVSHRSGTDVEEPCTMPTCFPRVTSELSLSRHPKTSRLQTGR